VRDRHLLAGTSWEIKTGENWAVLGPNGSGKSSLVKSLIGDVPVVRGRLIRHFSDRGRDRIGYVSFELHEGLIAREEGRDDARHFSGDLNGEQTAAELIRERGLAASLSTETYEGVVEQMKITHLLHRGVRRLSTGEMRRVLIARALVRSPWLLILDEPFDGLDTDSRRDLHDTVSGLIHSGTQVVLVTHRFEEIFAECTHVLCLKEGRVFCHGRRDEVITPDRIGSLYARPGLPAAEKQLQEETPACRPSQPGLMPALIEMKDVSVSYGGQPVLKGVDWVVRAGENWAVEGPNGSGKSTLLGLITGDHPQAYANDIRLFGRPKGSGETIWEIKQQLGVVSSEFHIRYRKRLAVEDMVVSGFFDSVGLFRHAAGEQIEAARYWIDRLGISHLCGAMVDQISYGERRMVLIARAMVKSPTILVLDEPCQGLDRANKKVVLELVDRIGSQTPTHLIYVTHHPDEIPACITHVLRLEKPVP
jgi:molybdate transport system ATP-binding protein